MTKYIVVYTRDRETQTLGEAYNTPMEASEAMKADFINEADEDYEYYQEKIDNYNLDTGEIGINLTSAYINGREDRDWAVISIDVADAFSVDAIFNAYKEIKKPGFNAAIILDFISTLTRRPFEELQKILK